MRTQFHATNMSIKSLRVSPVELNDFERMSAYDDTTTGDLSHPFLAVTWPASTHDETAARTHWSMKQQREQFLTDPTAVFMKVVDDETGEIVSLARWHFFRDGYKHPQDTWRGIEALLL